MKKILTYGIAWLVGFLLILAFPFLTRSILSYNSLGYNFAVIGFVAVLLSLFVFSILSIRQKTRTGRVVGVAELVLSVLFFTYIFILGGFPLF